jgi:glycosyltransferase involved in cell wall biosynthesis
MEATTVTGPAKNLLNFARLAQSPAFQAAGLPGVEVSIVTFHRKSNDDSPDDAAPNSFVATTREQGVQVHVIYERMRFDPQVISALRRIVAEHSPDIIQTHGVKSHFLVKLARLGKRYPWVAYHHGYTTTNLKMRGYNQLNRWSLPSAEKVVTVCQAFADQLVQAGVRANRTSVCHNSVVAPRDVTLHEQQTLRNRLGIADGQHIVLSVGRLSREKGHSDLVTAIALLRDQDCELEFKLLIVGEGPERERLDRAIRLHGLGDCVIFAGQTRDVAPYYAIADVLALPSHSEGSPNVLLEAMAASVPIVATSVGGVPEIAFANENALLVPAREPKLFAAALRRLIGEPNLRRTLSANASERVEKDFSPESYAQSLIKIYHGLVTEAGALKELKECPGVSTPDIYPMI